MTIVVDTSVLVDHLRGHEPAQRAIGRARMVEGVASSLVSKIEILAGMRPDEEVDTYRLFDELAWIAVDDEIAERAGRLANRFARTHGGIELADFVIAATSEVIGATLWTLNRRHFPMCAELPDPYGD